MVHSSQDILNPFVSRKVLRKPPEPQAVLCVVWGTHLCTSPVPSSWHKSLWCLWGWAASLGVASGEAGSPLPAPPPSRTSSSSGNVGTLPDTPSPRPGCQVRHSLIPTVHMGGPLCPPATLPTPQAPQTPPWGLPLPNLMWS